MVGVDPGDARAVADALRRFDEIDYVVITAGSVDLLVEAVCEDDDQLLDIVSRIRAPTAWSRPRPSSTSACASRPTPGAPARPRSSPAPELNRAQWQRPGWVGTSRARVAVGKPPGFSENETVSRA